MNSYENDEYWNESKLSKFNFEVDDVSIGGQFFTFFSLMSNKGVTDSFLFQGRGSDLFLTDNLGASTGKSNQGEVFYSSQNHFGPFSIERNL